MNVFPEERHPGLTMTSDDQPGHNRDSEPSTFDYQSQSEVDRQRQIKLIQNAIIGSNDETGQKITAILAKDAYFLIYRLEEDRDDDSLKIWTLDTTDDTGRIMVDNYDQIQLDLLKVYSAIPKSRNPKRALYKVATAIAMVLGSNPADTTKFATARAICAAVAEQIDKEYKSLIEGKRFYLVGCLSAAVALSILSIICFIFKQTDVVSNNKILSQLLYAATFASYGGFISVFTALNKLVFEPELGKVNYMFHGVVRILVSILGGIFVFMVVKSGLVLNVLSDSSLFSVFVFCFAAGFSEKLVPDLLRKIEAREDEKAK